MFTDFHSHILPGVDDGSGSVEESLAMLQMEADQGVCSVVATPHFYPRQDSPDRFLSRREKAMGRLQEALGKDGKYPQVLLGAEVLFFPGISESDQLERLTFDGKRCILIEMPIPQWTKQMYRELENIYSRRGILPIIAHVDRYIRPFHTHGIPEQLSQLPVMVQANAGFFIRPSTRHMALKMLRRQQIHILGSDCHNLSDRRPNLASAEQIIRSSLGTEALQWIQSNEEEILSLPE